jgi:hypothetical protein
MALAKPAEDLTLVLNCDSGMMVQGKFGPAALVRRSSQPLVTQCTPVPHFAEITQQLQINADSAVFLRIEHIHDEDCLHQNELRSMPRQILASALVGHLLPHSKGSAWLQGRMLSTLFVHKQEPKNIAQKCNAMPPTSANDCAQLLLPASGDLHQQLRGQAV